MSTVLITGANRGIGLELTKQLRARGETVIAAVRAASDDLKATGAEIVEGVDVRDDESVAKLADTVKDRTIDLLLHNAGVLSAHGLYDLDLEAVRTQLEVNAIGPLRLTAALVSRIPEGGKIAIVTSRMGSLKDNTSGGYYGYRMSKAAVNAAGVSLARDLAPKNISVVLLHPGFVRTRMTGGLGNIEPEESAKGLIAQIDGLTLSRSGAFVHMNGEALEW